jgi:F-type H+-transporting ATPase subunit delta
MKIKPKQYAISLYEATKGLSDEKAKAVLGNFVKLLSKNNALRFAPQIIDNFIRYANREEGIVDLKIRSAHPMKEDLIEILKKEAPGLLEITFKTANIRKEINSDLIGGFILECEDAVFDASLKNKFKILKNNLLTK